MQNELDVATGPDGRAILLFRTWDGQTWSDADRQILELDPIGAAFGVHDVGLGGLNGTVTVKETPIGKLLELATPGKPPVRLFAEPHPITGPPRWYRPDRADRTSYRVEVESGEGVLVECAVFGAETIVSRYRPLLPSPSASLQSFSGFLTRKGCYVWMNRKTEGKEDEWRFILPWPGTPVLLRRTGNGPWALGALTTEEFRKLSDWALRDGEVSN